MEKNIRTLKNILLKIVHKTFQRMFLILLALFLLSTVNAQKRLLGNDTILTEVKKCLSSTYGFKFQEAKKTLAAIEIYTPGHPVVPFLKSFIIYWEFYPIIPGHPEEKAFLGTIEECIHISETWVKKEPAELEAIFFDLFSRAFYAQYWADNGKTSRVFPHLNTMYHHTVQGFDLKEVFNEFYFTTGLYNYYIEAYPEKYPIFKPVVAFFKKGDQELGIGQLAWCAENSIFLRVEARYFLAFIQLSYENNLEKASLHASKLYREFPDNTLYAGKYLEVLLFNKKYFFAGVILDKLKKRGDPFSQLQYLLYHAYYLEKFENKADQSKQEYTAALEMSEQFGDFSRHFKAVALMGLGRHYNKTGNTALSNRFFRQAKSLTAYDYILGDR